MFVTALHMKVLSRKSLFEKLSQEYGKFNKKVMEIDSVAYRVI